jgi:hypothetical protein
MKSNLRDRYYGNTVEEWISKVPGELPIDAVGFWQIVSFARQGFGLSGDELVEAVRKALLALFEKGAKPVTGANDGIHYWIPVNYGDTAKEMADIIIREWLGSGRELDAGGIWFALPHIYEATRPTYVTAPIATPDLTTSAQASEAPTLVTPK